MVGSHLNCGDVFTIPTSGTNLSQRYQHSVAMETAYIPTLSQTLLPLVKLCAMVTMQKSAPITQSFALPLKLVIDDPEVM